MKRVVMEPSPSKILYWINLSFTLAMEETDAEVLSSYFKKSSEPGQYNYSLVSK